jgi:hypothetical protein
MYPLYSLPRSSSFIGTVRARGFLAQPGTTMQAVKGLAMEKGLCWASLAVSGLLLILFVLDLVLKIPFGGLSSAVDIICILAAGVLAYLSWDALSDLL